jgi:hypothetical protein
VSNAGTILKNARVLEERTFEPSLKKISGRSIIIASYTDGKNKGLAARDSDSDERTALSEDSLEES